MGRPGKVAKNKNFNLWEKKTFQCYNYLGKKDFAIKILTSGKKRFFNVIIIWEKKSFLVILASGKKRLHLGKKDIPKNASGKKRHCKKGIWEKKIMHIFVGIWEKKIFIWEKKN